VAEPLHVVVVAVAVIAALWLLAVAVIWLHRPSRQLALPVLRLMPDVVRLVRRLLADPATSRRVRLALLLLLVWLLSPIDLIPEFLPGIGPLDDVVVAALVLRWAGRRSGSAALRRHWPGSDAGFELLLRLLALPGPGGG
jgi:uncharacterized membrane protein YkvA (DUF1232 family)